jgi:hypothetical protein
MTDLKKEITSQEERYILNSKPGYVEMQNMVRTESTAPTNSKSSLIDLEMI